MPRRHFTVGEIERLIPTLEQIFTQVLQLRMALRREEQKLERAGVRVSGNAQDATSRAEPQAVRHARAMFQGYYEALSDQISRIEALGGEVKDVDLGLVDFPGQRGTQEILLCWKLGERVLGFWHPVDAGYGARKPIDELVPREPPGLD